jgi:hypothetical protein
MDGFNVKAAILALVKGGPEAAGEQTDLPEVDELIGRRTAQHCDANLLQTGLFGEPATESLAFYQYVL